jgi:diguanylate cyclase (GGDEF)-like protein
LLFLLILGPFVSIMSNQIKRPIDWLVEQAGLIAQEKYGLVGTTRPQGRMPNELMLLCNTFMNMSKLLERNIGLIKEHECELIGKVAESQELNATLEEEVAEREAAQLALAEMNAGLETIVRQRTQELQEMNASLEEEIAERKAAQEELEQQNSMVYKLAYTDVLTGLANRAGLNERLALELERTRRGDTGGAVIFIDLDDFKMVNDAFGHSYGDALLQAAGDRLSKIAGLHACVGRVGGDEFMLICPRAKQEETEEVADQIIQALNRDFAVQGIHFRVSASAGITRYPEDGDTAEDIFKNADNAMYAAKAAGKNRWQFYQSSMQSDAYEKVLLIDQLRGAADRGELSLHYQPQIRSNDRAVVGFEALLRWRHPQYGAISPERFIPLAEQSGLIQSIGEWVVREACQFGRTLTAAGWLSIQIAVNVSPYQLCYEGFVDSVKQALSDTGVTPGRLELEITENTLIASLDDSTSVLSELRELGVGLALDDFGTGYSSLTYLQALPASTLKIDKTFIDKLMFNDEQQSIVKTIVELAHSLNMTVVAEGVETEEQLAFLKHCQCDQIQGYVFSPPLAKEEALALLQISS